MDSTKIKDELKQYATSVCFCCSLPATEDCPNFENSFETVENIGRAYRKVTGLKSAKLVQDKIGRICRSCEGLLHKAQEFFKLCSSARTQPTEDDYVQCILCRLQNVTLYQIRDKFIDHEVTLCDGIKKALKLKKAPSMDSKICEPCFGQFELISFFRSVCLSGRELTLRRLENIKHMKVLEERISSKLDGDLPPEDSKDGIKLESDNSSSGYENFDNGLNQNDGSSLDSNDDTEPVVDVSQDQRKKTKRKTATYLATDDDDALFPIMKADSLPPSTWVPRRRAPNRKVAKTTFSCALCAVTKAGKFDLKCHLFETHFTHLAEAKTLIRCNFCAKMHVSKEKHLQHITRYHPKQLNSGVVSRITPEPFLCNICGKKFVTSQSLNYHFDVHSPGRKYKCEFEGCSTAYRHPRDLNRHRRDFHTGGSFKCPHCRRHFTTLKRLEVHKGLLHSQDNWICEQCGKSFETRMRLMKHEYRHKGYNPYNCMETMPGTDSLCNYTTATKSCFAQHLMSRHGVEFNETIHTRPIPEELAKQIYQQRTTAKQESMAYRCTQPGCSKGFQTSTGLHHHLKMHQNIMYKCRLCPKQFTQKPALWEHSFTHQDFSPFECANFRNNCDYKSNAKRPFANHLKTKHNQIYSEEVHGYKRQTFQQVMDFIMG